MVWPYTLTIKKEKKTLQTILNAVCCSGIGLVIQILWCIFKDWANDWANNTVLGARVLSVEKGR